MPSRRLTVVAILSLFVLGLVLAGNVGRFGPTFGWSTGGGTPAFRGIGVFVEEGRFAVRLETFDKTYPFLPKGVGHLFRLDFNLRLPRIDRLLWSFDCHRLDAGFSPGLRMYLFACPLWCIELPCLIAPLLWWRRRRRAETQGFVVILQGTPDATLR